MGGPPEDSLFSCMTLCDALIGIFYDALSCKKTLISFSAQEGARLHCQEGARLLGNQRIFDWIDETLARK